MGAVPKKNLAERLEEKLYVISVALIVIWAFATGFRPVMDAVDLGWHVAQGRWMAHHAAFYRHDVLNYPNLGHGVIDEYPLFQLVLYAAWSLGWWGPCLLTAVAYALLALVFFFAARTLGLRLPVALPMAVALALVFLQVVTPLRPHIATYLGIAILGVFLLRHRNAERWTIFWPMALLQIAWVNAHSGFVIGPGMAGLFGLEMTLRRWFADKSLPLRTARTWLAVVIMLTLACFLNPYGAPRLYLPIYQDQLESIRAYVGEMQALGGQLASIYFYFALASLLPLGLAILAARGAVSYSFLLLLVFFYLQAQSAQKAWPVCGLYLPLLVLSSGVFAKYPLGPLPRIGIVVQSVVALMVGLALIYLFSANLPGSLPSQWRQHDRDRTEISTAAADWLLAHGLTGRLFHRCEDGGMLQMVGFDQGQVFADTGFGKYDAAFIHEVGLVNERPAFVPHYLAAYQPDIVVCGTFCYQWPYYLRRSGWRPVFYSPNSSAWLGPNLRADLPTVTDAEIQTAFDRDIADHGMPTDVRLFGRNLIALNSFGLEDFAFARLTGLPAGAHHAGWYWEAARFVCFDQPPFSMAHRDALVREASQLRDDGVTAEFRACALDSSGDANGARAILEGIPPGQLDNGEATLLLKIDLQQQRPEAIALARRTDCFDLRNGRHWMYLAQTEENAGHIDAARAAWKKAVFYYPDDDALIAAATTFASRHADAALAQDIADRNTVYGRR